VTPQKLACNKHIITCIAHTFPSHVLDVEPIEVGEAPRLPWKMANAPSFLESLGLHSQT
jgi:hypothetical protein